MNKKELWAKAAELVGEQELSRRFCNWCSNLIKKELVKRSESSADEFFLQQAHAILDDLNRRAKRHHRLNPETSKMIRVLLGRGYHLEDFIRVHEVKCLEWLNDESFEKYLQPSTLYRVGKFPGYLEQWETMDAKKLEMEAKRAAAMKGRQVNAKTATSEKAQERLIAKLLAKQWWEFATWADFMRWTAQLPTAEAVECYPMPDKIRKMRLAPRMLMRVLSGEAMPAVEEEYQKLKKQHADHADKGNAR
jgi:uncharacterized phage protein (TIGR02220 family)